MNVFLQKIFPEKKPTIKSPYLPQNKLIQPLSFLLVFRAKKPNEKL